MNTPATQLPIDSLHVRRVGGDDVTARIAITVVPRPVAGCGFSVEVCECGVDGVRASTPLVATPPRVDAHGDVSLSIPTPFRWSDTDRPMYALCVWPAPGPANWRAGSPDPAGLFQHSAGIEITFGFTADDTVQVVGERRVGAQPTPLPAPAGPRLFVVGDSTAFSFGRNQLGWADALAQFVSPAAARICNRARPGRSTRSFRREGLWERARAEFRRGDVVLIQFGHNDADALAQGRCRGVLPGIGDETVAVRLPDGTDEPVHTFGWYLRQFVDEARAIGARPVLLSPTPRNVWRGDRLDRNQGPYGGWAAEVAALSSTDFVDVTSLVADCFDALGAAAVAVLFCSATDPVHTSRAGARELARCITAALLERRVLPPQPLDSLR